MLTYGTPYFTSYQSALAYYLRQGFDVRGVDQKIQEGEIFIGEPQVPRGCKLSLVDGGARYAIQEGE